MSEIHIKEYYFPRKETKRFIVIRDSTNWHKNDRNMIAVSNMEKGRRTLRIKNPIHPLQK